MKGSGGTFEVSTVLMMPVSRRIAEQMVVGGPTIIHSGVKLWFEKHTNFQAVEDACPICSTFFASLVTSKQSWEIGRDAGIHRKNFAVFAGPFRLYRHFSGAFDYTEREFSLRTSQRVARRDWKGSPTQVCSTWPDRGQVYGWE